jgi:C_GCAxxG_C_C family probable redox protein
MAVEKFKAGYNCAQAVVFGFRDRTGAAHDSAFRAATGFGAGMGRKQEVCGAITGALIALGLLHGRNEGDGSDTQDRAYALVRKVMDEFAARHGSVLCSRLLDGCALGTPAGQERFRSEDMKNKKCVLFVATAADVLDKIIAADAAGV